MDSEEKHDSYNKHMGEKFYYTVMSLGEIKVLFQDVYKCKSESYNPKNMFKSPIEAARRWSY